MKEAFVLNNAKSEEIPVNTISVTDPEKTAAEKRKKIRKIIRSLQTVKGKTKEDKPQTYSNDEEIEQHIWRIKEQVKMNTAPISVAIVVSNGGLWSLPKELANVDIVLRINVNKKQIPHDKKRRREILKAQNVEALLPTPRKNPPIDPIGQRKERARLLSPKVEGDSYGNYHYLRNNHELRQTQQFLEKRNIAFVAGDLTDTDFMSQLGEVLKGYEAQIVYADLSNVIEWVSRPEKEDTQIAFINSLKLLPVHESCAILHSTHTGMAGRSKIRAHFSLGLDGYLRDSQRARVV